jgi:hypothetical protein
MIDIHYRNNNMDAKNIEEQLDMDIQMEVFEKDNYSLLKEISS